MYLKLKGDRASAPPHPDDVYAGTLLRWRPARKTYSQLASLGRRSSDPQFVLATNPMGAVVLGIMLLGMASSPSFTTGTQRRTKPPAGVRIVGIHRLASCMIRTSVSTLRRSMTLASSVHKA